MDPHCEYVFDDQQRLIQVVHTDLAPIVTIHLDDNCPKSDLKALLLAMHTRSLAKFLRHLLTTGQARLEHDRSRAT